VDCVTIRAALLGYHLGSCEDEECERVDGHLLGCQGCLRAYLALRRAAEAVPPAGAAASGATDDGAGPRPSQAMRLRLRADVARSFRRTPARRLRQLLGRPVLYQAATAALLLLFLGLLPRWLREAPPALEAVAPVWDAPLPGRAPRPPRAAEVREVIDTSRPEAASLSIL
jgi:hypothetical protein